MTEDQFAEAIVEVLREYVDRIRLRVSREVGGVSYYGADAHGIRTPQAGFSLLGGDDELLLSVSIRGDSRGLTCDCDLGVYKETFATMPPVTVVDTNDATAVEELVRTVRNFVVAQDEKTVSVLQQDAAGTPWRRGT